MRVNVILAVVQLIRKSEISRKEVTSNDYEQRKKEELQIWICCRSFFVRE